MDDQLARTEVGSDVLGLGRIGAQAIKTAEPFLLKLLGPYLEEKGQYLADGVREKRRQNLMAVLSEAAHQVGARDMNAVPGRVLFPILEAASNEDQPDLQAKWAALMAVATTDPARVPPAFPKILSELSSLEAKALDAIRRLDRRNARFQNTDDGPKISELAPSGVGANEMRIALANLIRLGLVGMDLMPEDVDIFRDDDAQFLAQAVRLTGFGASFIDACTPAPVVEAEIVNINKAP